jgi:tetratricopeptide (TPR) repeat protein
MIARQRQNVAAELRSASQLLEQGSLEAAAELFSAVLRGAPRHHEALFKLALTCNLLGLPEEAKTYYDRVLLLTPKMAEANNNLGEIYYRQGQLDQALACFERARAERPHSAEAHNNTANVLKDQGKFEAALASYDKADELRPGNAAVLCNSGDVLRRLNRFDESISRLRKAIAIKPELTEAHHNLALALFMRGDLGAGLPLYEKRLDVGKNPQFAAFGASGVAAMLSKLSAIPRWQGEPLQGKSLLVWTEQGIGDSLMMLRYIALLKAQGAGLTAVCCGPELAGIFLDNVDVVIDRRAQFPAGSFDLHCPIMSLPYCFKTTLDNIPNHVPYLTVPTAARNRWAARFRQFPGPRVGLVWAGNRQLKSDHLRSTTLARYAPLMQCAGVHFFSLQQGEAARELQSVDWPIQDWMHDCGDIAHTAALIDHLDLVISVDTAVAHLAGALGKPIWLLNRFESEWRWMMEREDSPWYPSMRIFRQPAVHDWDSVIARVCIQLEIFVRAHEPRASVPSVTSAGASAEITVRIEETRGGRGFLDKLMRRRGG